MIRTVSELIELLRKAPPDSEIKFIITPQAEQLVINVPTKLPEALIPCVTFFIPPKDFP